jgi:hypothetical protein
MYHTASSMRPTPAIDPMTAPAINPLLEWVGPSCGFPVEEPEVEDGAGVLELKVLVAFGADAAMRDCSTGSVVSVTVTPVVFSQPVPLVGPTPGMKLTAAHYMHGQRPVDSLE